jgi:hypothetical protein
MPCCFSLHHLIHLVFITVLWGTYCCCFKEEGNEGEMGNLPKVRQLVDGNAGI